MRKSNYIGRSIMLVMLLLLACLTIGTLTTEARTKSGKCIYCSNPCYGQSCYCKDHDPEYKRTHTKCYVKDCNFYTAEGCGSYCAYHYNQKFGKKTSGSKATSATKSTTSSSSTKYKSGNSTNTTKKSTSSASKYNSTTTSKKKTKTDPYDVNDYDDPDDFAEEWAEEFGDGSFDDGYDDAFDYWEEEH